VPGSDDTESGHRRETPPGSVAAAGSALARRATLGAVWTISTSVGARAVGLAGTLLLTKFIAPDVYGEVSLAAVIIQTAHAVSSCGLSQYIVSKPHEGRAATFHATFYFTLLGVLALGLAVLFREPLGALIGAPGMARFLPGLAIAGLLERVGTVQDRILVRDMRFAEVGLLRSLGEVAYAVVTVALAWTGWGAGAVVWGSIVRSAVRLVGLSMITARREWLSPSRLTLARTRDLFAFGLPISIAGLAGFGSRRWDNLIFSSLFGESAAGLYNLAYNLADIPATQIGETIGDVLVPSFAQMDSDDRRRAALCRSMRLLILIVAPLALGLGAIAPTLVRALFDPRWVAVAPMLTWLSALSIVRPIAWIGASYLQVKNEPRAIMLLEVTKTCGLLAAIALLGRVGPLWACAAVGIAFTLGSLGYFWVIRRIDGLTLREQILPLVPPVLACAPMVAAILAARRGLVALGGVPSAAGLLVELLVGVLIFIPAALVLAPSASRDLLRLLQAARSRHRPAEITPDPRGS
jgi:PST family polysaccharide transporter